MFAESAVGDQTLFDTTGGDIRAIEIKYFWGESSMLASVAVQVPTIWCVAAGADGPIILTVTAVCGLAGTDQSASDIRTKEFRNRRA